MARPGMTHLIQRLRSMTAAGSADFALAGITYWSDDVLQDRLDANRIDFRAPLIPQPEIGAGGGPAVHDYRAPFGDLEEAASGTLYWCVQNALGEVAGTADYNADYAAGLIRFSADQGGTAYWLHGRSYHLSRAAAAVWREKAASAAAYYSFRADDQQLNRSEWFEHCLEMARHFDAESGILPATISRSDLT